MKRLAILTGILALAAPLALAQTSTWVSDRNHSEVDFSVTHMSISKVHGRFGNVNATIQYNEADITRSSVQVTIDVATVDTGVAPRDADLKSARFFDVAHFPTATFTSTERGQARQQTHRNRQPDPAWRHQARDFGSRGSQRPGSRHGQQAALRILGHAPPSADRLSALAPEYPTGNRGRRGRAHDRARRREAVSVASGMHGRPEPSSRAGSTMVWGVHRWQT